MSRAERLFSLAQFLQTKSGRTLCELAEHFEVSQRTVFRDLSALEKAGVPIRLEEGRYRILEAQTPPLSLDSGELALLRIALSNPDLLGPRRSAGRSLSRLLAKLDAALRGHGHGRPGP